MRKHFLILMLMALLPLAGWAVPVDISTYTLNYKLGGDDYSANTSFDYNGTGKAVTVVSLTGTGDPATINEGLTFVIRKGNKTTGNVVTEIKDAGDYYIVVSAANHTGTKDVKVTVNKKALTIKAKCTDDTYKLAYGQAAFDASKYTLVYDGLVPADKKMNGLVPVVPDEPIDGIKKGTLTYNVTGPLPSHTEPYAAFSPAGEYHVVPAGISFDNYNVTFGTNPKVGTVLNGTLVVAPKSITDATVTVAATAETANLVYKAAAQNPVLVVKDAANNNATIPSSDYTLKYFDDAAKANDPEHYPGEDAATSSNAGTYYIRVTAKDETNYTGFRVYSYTIAKKNLVITSKDGMESNYIGKYATSILAGWVLKDLALIDGLEAADKDENGMPKEQAYAAYDGVHTTPMLSVAYYQGSTKVAEPVNAGAYKIHIVSPVSDPDLLLKNYNLSLWATGTATIKPAPLTITLVNQSSSIGKTHPLDAESVTVTAADLASYGTITGFVNGQEFNGGLVITKAATEESNVWKLVGDASNMSIILDGDPVEQISLANYAITINEDATYTIGTGLIQVLAEAKTINYGDAKATLTFMIQGVTDEADLATARAAIQKIIKIRPTGKPLQADNATVTDGVEVATYPNSGQYEIYFDEETDPTWFDALKANYSFKGYTGKYTIKRREMKSITVKAQSVVLGAINNGAITTANVNDLLAAPSAGTVEFALKDGDTYKITDNDRRQLYDDIRFTIDGTVTGPGTTATAISTYLDAHSFVAGTYSKAIKIDATPAADKVLTNFILKNHATLGAVWNIAGDLIVTPNASADIALNRNTENFYTTYFVGTTTPAVAPILADGDIVNISFANDRLLKAETWTAMVLPFNISVAELSRKLGYAVVNVLADDATAENVKFVLTMGTIPANTPFLVKTAEEKDMNDDDVVFEGVTIVKPASADAVVGNDAVKFHGVYNEITRAFTANEWISANNKWYANYKNGMKPLAAYIEIVTPSAGAPKFTVQDENGNVTAISSIAADGRLVEAEGWYTVNGMRLEGAPVEKGIYVRNGKKIVIK